MSDGRRPLHVFLSIGFSHDIFGATDMETASILKSFYAVSNDMQGGGISVGSGLPVVKFEIIHATYRILLYRLLNVNPESSK